MSIRVVSAPMQIAGASSIYKPHLAKAGIDMRVVDYHPNYLDYRADVVVDIAAAVDPQCEMWREAVASLAWKPDVLHCWFGGSLAPNWADISIARAMRTMTIMHHCGSDVRTVSGARGFSPWARPKPCDEARQSDALRAMARHVDLCLVTEPRLLLYTAPYYARIRALPFVVDVDAFAPTPASGRRVPKVVHAPTSRCFKGTDIIMGALEQAKSRGVEFEVDLVEGVAHVEARKRFLDADLVIDQVLDGGIGAFAGEMMASGKPVVAYLCPAYIDGVPEAPPVASANPLDIVDALCRLLTDAGERADRGAAGPQWVRRWHSPQATTPLLAAAYAGELLDGGQCRNIWRNGETGEVVDV